MMSERELCECGCGQEVTKRGNRFVSGHNSRVNNPMWNPRTREKVSIALKGKLLSEEHKVKLSIAHKGKRLSENAKRKLSQHFRGRKRKPFTEEHRRNISRGLKGKYIGERNPFYGKSHTQEAKEKMSLAAKKRTGRKSNNWRGGISFVPYSSDFNQDLKMRIRKMDKFTCQLGHETESELGRSLQIHHIDYCKENNEETNLTSLCERCHGKTNGNRSFWRKFFEEKLAGVRTG